MGMQSNILFTRGILPKVQSTWVTSRSNNNQGHVKHGNNSNTKDRTLWITFHNLEIRGTPFNLNVEAYDKAISGGHFPHKHLFSTKHWDIGYQIHKANNSKV